MTDKKWYDNAVMVNRDPNWYGAAEGESAEECRASLQNYLSRYAGAVTDVLIGVLEQTSIIPSKHIMWRGDKVLQKVENGKEVDYTYLSMMRLYRAYAEFLGEVFSMADDRGEAYVQPVGYLLVDEAAYDEYQHLHFAWRQAEVVPLLPIGHGVGVLLVSSLVEA